MGAVKFVLLIFVAIYPHFSSTSFPSYADSVDCIFKDGGVYNYKYDVTIQTRDNLFKGISEVNYTTDFTIYATAKNNYLKINSVQIIDNTKKVEINSTNNEFTKYYLRFENQKRPILIEPDKREETWVLNFKKGLLSLFQIYTDQSDIHGHCDKKLEKIAGDNNWRRRKDLKTCQRENDNQFIQFFNEKPDKYETNGEQVCDYNIKSNVYREIYCFEHVTIDELTNTAFNVIYQNVTLLSRSLEDMDFLSEISYEPNFYSSLYYTFHDRNEYKESKINYIEKVCDQEFEYSSVEGHDVLIKWYLELKTFNLEQLREVKLLANKCKLSKKIYFDTLPTLDTYESVKLMLEIINEQEKLPRYIEEEWLALLTYTKKINSETIPYIKKLLENNKTKNPNAILTATAMIKNSIGIKESYQITNDEKDLINYYKNEILGLFKQREEKSELLFVYLKGLANMGNILNIITDLNVELIGVLTQDKKLPVYLRKQAVELNTDYSVLENLLKNPSEDNEVRIFIFSKFIKEERQNLKSIIEKILLSETNSQVAHFIWSFLQNIDKQKDNFRSSHTTLSFSTYYEDLLLLRNRLIMEITTPACETKQFSYFSKIEELWEICNTSVIFTKKSFIPSNVKYDLRNSNNYNGSLDIHMENIEKYFVKTYEKEGNQGNEFVSFDFKMLDFNLKHFSFKEFNFDFLKKSLRYGFDLINDLRKSGRLFEVERTRITGAGLAIYHNLKVLYAFETKVDTKKLETKENPKELHFNGTVRPWLSFAVLSSTKVDCVYTKSQQITDVGVSLKIAVNTHFDLKSLDYIQLLLNTPAEDVKGILKIKHFTGSNKVADKLNEMNCENDLPYLQICAISENLNKQLNEYIEMPFNNILEENQTYYFKWTWTKLEDNNYKFIIDNSHIRVSRWNGERIIKFNNTADGVDVNVLMNNRKTFTMKSKYSNTGHKYFLLDIKNNDKLAESSLSMLHRYFELFSKKIYIYPGFLLVYME